MLEHRRYKLLMDLPPLKGNEPEFVQKCYTQCMEIRRQLPSLFKKIEPLPTFIMERYKQRGFLLFFVLNLFLYFS